MGEKSSIFMTHSLQLKVETLAHTLMTTCMAVRLECKHPNHLHGNLSPLLLQKRHTFAKLYLQCASCVRFNTLILSLAHGQNLKLAWNHGRIHHVNEASELTRRYVRP